MLLIGLTGGVGSGKSAVAQCFMEHGITVVDADAVAKNLLLPNSLHVKRIAEELGADLVENGELNRRKLRTRIFSDASAKAWLDQYLHPKIRSSMNEQAVKATSAYVIAMVPLLVENQLMSQYQRICVVDTLPETQIARVMARDDVTEAEAKAMIAAQTSPEARLRVADDVISNNGTLAELRKQVDALHEKYLSLASCNKIT